MPCPNCDHTMHSIGKLDAGQILYWCPRCGTLRRRTMTFAGSASPFHSTGRYETDVAESHNTDETPLLVGRSKEVAAALANEHRDTDFLVIGNLHRLAYRIGLYESCMTPEQRKEINYAIN